MDQNNQIIKNIERKLQENFGREYNFRSERSEIRNTIQIKSDYYPQCYSIFELSLDKTKSLLPEFYQRGSVQIDDEIGVYKRIQIKLNLESIKLNPLSSSFADILLYVRYNPFMVTRSNPVHKEDEYLSKILSDDIFLI